jgi:hypothetical protein
MTGQFGNGSGTEYVLAWRSGFGPANPAPQSGRYTLIFSDSDRPLGSSDFSNGFGSLSVDALGTFHFNGRLVDGSRITQGGTISDTGEWPFYASLRTDVLAGWILFTNAPNTDLAGRIYQVKTGELDHPPKFLNPLDVFGFKIQSTSEVAPPVQR